MRVVLLCFFLASPALTQDKGIVAATLAGCGPSNVKFDVKQEPIQPAIAPESGKALAYVIEDIGTTECLGGCVTLKVGLDGSWAGANQGNSHFSFSVAAGEHHLCANWQSSFQRLSSLYALANFTAEASKVYYFRVRTLASTGTEFLDFEAVNSDEGRYLVAASVPVTSHPKK